MLQLQSVQVRQQLELASSGLDRVMDNVVVVVVVHCVSKNDNDVLHYNINAHQPILIIFGRHIANEYAIK